MIPHSRPTLDKQDYITIKDVISSKYIAEGNKVKEFEQALASYIGVKSGVAVSSGTAALHLALIGMGIKAEDEVILPTFVCTAPLHAINYISAKPVFVDIEESTFNLSVSDIKNKLTRKTKLIIVPHLFGLPADMDEILSLGVPVIEDCAHSIGAKYHSKEVQPQEVRPQMVGSMGAASIFSFYATKMMTTGEGGMVLSNDEKFIAKIRDLREYDEKDNYTIRFNYKMTDIQATIGISQLNKLPKFIARRQEIAQKYNSQFPKFGICPAFFGIPHLREDLGFGIWNRVWYRYIIRAKKDATEYINKLRLKGIECKKPIYKPLHQYMVEAKQKSRLPRSSGGSGGRIKKGFPIADRVYSSAISIPIYPSLTDKEVHFIIDTINSLV
ncbi:MAG: DegT/DnrJ/EryC1/StrS family aminotransferase [Candidatus Stahlbacteria bacterium]|nr:DegT/DnrJ/EryC1/StrS family aminotransferase [Candidatus Stahlbacteria bacterium]